MMGTVARKGGIFGGLWGRQHDVDTKMSSAELEALLRGGSQSSSGVTVNHRTALQVTTMLACARVIAEGIAQVPWKVYQGDAGRVEARDHPLADLLHRRPNSWQTSFELRETVGFHLVLGGNSFLRKMRVGSARRLAAIEPFEPGFFRVEREPDYRLRYFHRPEHGSEREIPADEVWHLKGPSWNSWLGLDITRLAREAIGLALATESAHAEMHRGGSRISGIYTVQNTLSAEKFAFLEKWIAQYQLGGPKAGHDLILDSGAKFERTQMSGVDAQHVETRRLQIEEICRAMRVMPIMVGQSDKASTYASAEQMFLAHVVHTLMPWYERLEQSADVNLLTEAERRAGYYTKFNPNALMRGAAKDRADFYAKALGAGGQKPWMAADEVRRLEDLAPYGGHAAELGQGAMNATPADSSEENPVQ